ncbi:FG-GAP-like repeat-containing protein, partial [Myxococcota bacterium]|nr:FG-GAP-like repeat-containing protein [Myxococcota bacterium]
DGDGYTVAEGDCDDTDDSSYPGGTEDDDLADNDCDGLVDEDFVEDGDVLITEIMVDPSKVSDAYGEWFELQNLSGRAIDLVGWEIRSDDGDTLTITESLVVEHDDYVVLGVEDDTSINGGANVDYLYDRDDFSLSNDSDALFVYVLDAVVSEVEYTSSWPLTTGYSLNLDDKFGNASTVSDVDYWCEARRTYGSGDYGTPGSSNSWCTHLDHDGDGVTVDDGDCNDNSAAAYPGADDLWDGIDNDCDDLVDNTSVDHATGYLDGVDTDYLGWQSSLSTGDFDGDGQIDVAVGGTYINSSGTGGMYVVDGSDFASWAGDAEDYAESDLDGTGYYGYFGTLDQEQGDIDGDGVTDLVVGGTDYYYGPYYGNVAAGIWLGGAFPADAESDEADILFQGAQSFYYYTKLLSSSDFDGDGAADIFYGDYYGYSSSNRYGYVHYFSGADLVSGTTYELADDSDAIFYGNNNNDYLGYAFGGGDINGDGYDEIAVAASGADDGAVDGGAVYLVRGRGTFSGEGNVSFVAYASVVGANEDDRLGRHGQPQLADFDGDGNLDLAVAAPDASESAGQAYIFYTASALSGETSTAEADVTITGTGPEYFGMALASGDLDGDGQADLVVGAPDSRTYDETPNEAGLVYYFAGSDLAAGDWSAEDASASVSSSSATMFGISLAVADISGDGQDDLLAAAPWYGGTEGRVYLFVTP